MTALAILSLGFAIGFCTVGFSLLDAGWLRDLPLRQPAQMHWLVARDREQRIANLTWIEYQALASRGRVWEVYWPNAARAPKSGCRIATISPSPREYRQIIPICSA